MVTRSKFLEVFIECSERRLRGTARRERRSISLANCEFTSERTLQFHRRLLIVGEIVCRVRNGERYSKTLQLRKQCQVKPFRMLDASFFSLFETVITVELAFE